jgi:hypothetical protein
MPQISLRLFLSSEASSPPSFPSTVQRLFPFLKHLHLPLARQLKKRTLARPLSLYLKWTDDWLVWSNEEFDLVWCLIVESLSSRRLGWSENDSGLGCVRLGWVRSGGSTPILVRLSSSSLRLDSS